MIRLGLSTLLKLEGGVVNDLFPAEGGVPIVDGVVAVIMVVVTHWGGVFSVLIGFVDVGGVTLVEGVSAVIVVVVSGTLGVCCERCTTY